MKVISNASPIIALSLIERLHILKDLWREIIIPEAVYNEVVIKPKGKHDISLIEDAIDNNWIKVIGIKNRLQAKMLMSILDIGEAEAIILAQEISADLVILDNKEPRLFAYQIGLKVIGTIGIILKAYEKKIIKEPLKEIYRLKDKGFYIRKDLLEYIEMLLKKKSYKILLLKRFKDSKGMYKQLDEEHYVENPFLAHLKRIG